MNLNADILLLRADKGNSSIKKKNDYLSKMPNLLNESKTYLRVKNNPTSKIQKQNNKIV